MTGSRKNKKKLMAKQLLTVGLLLFIIATAGITWAQSRNVRSEQAPDFGVGKLKKENNWEIELGDQKFDIPADASLYGCNREEIRFKAYMKGAQAKVIFKKIETPDGETVKQVDKLYIICK